VIGNWSSASGVCFQHTALVFSISKYAVGAQTKSRFEAVLDVSPGGLPTNSRAVSLTRCAYRRSDRSRSEAAPELAPVLLRETGEGEQVGARLPRAVAAASGKRFLSCATIPACARARLLGEDRADYRRNEALGALRYA
jgi:hypothetical protein